MSAPDKPAKADDAALVSTKEGDEGEKKKRGPLAWALGWIAVPGAVLGGIFAGGVIVGANFHDSWVTRAFVWIGNLGS